MKIETVKSDGKVYHLTSKNETRPVLGPTAIPTYGKRFRGRIVLKHDNQVTWGNCQREVGIQGFRSVRITWYPDTGTAEIASS